MMHRLLKPSLLLTAALFAVSAFLVVAQDAETTNIAVFIPVLGNSYTQSFTDGIENMVGPQGASIQVFSGEYDQTEQLNQMQDAVTSGNFNAFIVYAIDGNGVIPGVQAALDAGIVVVGADVVIGPDRNSLVPYPGLAAFIGSTGEIQGTGIGEMIVMACEDIDPCEVAYLIGVQALTIDQDRLAAIESVIAEHPNIQIVTVQEALYLQDNGYNVTQNILQSNPEIDVIASSGDQMTLGAELAVQEAGLEGQIKLIGNGAGREGWQAVSEGRFFASYANIPYTQGQIAGQLTMQALRGELVIASVNTQVQSPPLPAGGAIITQANADQYEPQW
jgi:ribose transport system substrate-binding protein